MHAIDSLPAGPWRLMQQFIGAPQISVREGRQTRPAREDSWILKWQREDNKSVWIGAVRAGEQEIAIGNQSIVIGTVRDDSFETAVVFFELGDLVEHQISEFELPVHLSILFIVNLESTRPNP